MGTASGKKNSRSSGSSTNPASRRPKTTAKLERKLAICIDKAKDSAIFGPATVYGNSGRESGQGRVLRVIDDSGGDDLYPQIYFVLLRGGVMRPRGGA
jgi:hypothetical protein